jgi:hypothetical protein
MKKFLLVFLILLSACHKNPYKTNYIQKPLYSSSIKSKASAPIILYSENVLYDTQIYETASYERDQYNLIGTANFSDKNIKDPESQIRQAAKDVGADLVLWNKAENDFKYDYQTAFLIKLENSKFGYFYSDVQNKEERRVRNSNVKEFGKEVSNGIISTLTVSAILILNAFIQIIPFLLL